MKLSGASAGGASSARVRPSTPSRSQSARARVGPRSGPPCLCEPPTTVGAMLFAPLAQALAPFQPLAALNGYRPSPTVGGVPVGVGHVKCAAYRRLIATRTNLGRSWGTPYSHALRTCQ